MPAEIFRGRIPDDGRRYDPRHDMWVRRDDHHVVIGTTAFGIFLAGRIVAFTSKPAGAEVVRGRGLGTVESAKTVLAVHAPLSFILEQANADAEARPEWLNEDPHGRGWLVRGRALAWERESADLIDARAYLAHVRAADPTAIVELSP